jgi:phosphonoacetate hydrolase
MPALAGLIARGTRFAHARSVFPSETRVATPSLVTGCRPAAHGMVGNTVFDRALAPDRLLRTKDAGITASSRPGRNRRCNGRASGNTWPRPG